MQRFQAPGIDQVVIQIGAAQRGFYLVREEAPTADVLVDDRRDALIMNELDKAVPIEAGVAEGRAGLSGGFGIVGGAQAGDGAGLPGRVGRRYGQGQSRGELQGHDTGYSRFHEGELFSSMKRR